MSLGKGMDRKTTLGNQTSTYEMEPPMPFTST
jgi:hypothetical protein